MKIVNKTPHDVNFINNNNEVVQTITPELPAIRLSMSTDLAGLIEGIPVIKTVYGEVENLLEEADDTVYIVSALVMQALPDRKDLYVPGDVVRDEAGKIIGCKALSR